MEKKSLFDKLLYKIYLDSVIFYNVIGLLKIKNLSKTKLVG